MMLFYQQYPINGILPKVKSLKVACFNDEAGGFIRFPIYWKTTVFLENERVIDLYRYLSNVNVEGFLSRLKKILREYNLCSRNKDAVKEGFYKLKEKKDEDLIFLFVLLCFSAPGTLSYGKKVWRPKKYVIVKNSIERLQQNPPRFVSYSEHVDFLMYDFIYFILCKKPNSKILEKLFSEQIRNKMILITGMKDFSSLPENFIVDEGCVRNYES